MSTGSRGQRWATARERTVRLVTNQRGVQVFSRRIVFCTTGLSPENLEQLDLEPLDGVVEKFAPPCESIPKGWCHVRGATPSFDLCVSCQFNDGIATEETHTLKSDTAAGFQRFQLRVLDE